MFKVKICDCVLYQSERVEPCLEFALAVHRSSNVVHDLSVVSSVAGDEIVIVTLSLVDEDFKRSR